MLRQILAGESTPDPHDDFWYGSVGINTQSGSQITKDNSMQVTAVYACVKVIAETLSSLPFILYERNGENKNRAVKRPLYNILHSQPNSWQTSMEFREMMMYHLLLRGNAYAQKVKSFRSESLIPLHPDFVKPVMRDDMSVYYQVQTKGGLTTLEQSEVFHIRGMSSDGLVGLSPIEQHRETIGATMAANDYSSRFFKNDAKPGGVLKHPGHFKDKEQRSNFAKAWQQAQGGLNRGKTAVLEDGIEYQEVGVSNKDAQFLESRQYNNIDIARIFRVPPHMIGDLTKSAFSNIEQQSLDFVIHTMRPWFVRWEQAVSRDLINENDKYFAEFLVDGLLRGDIKSRYEAYGSAITNGWMTRNEARISENRNPIDGLDEPLQQLNMASPNVEPNQQAMMVARKEAVSVTEANDRIENKDEFSLWAIEYYGKFRKYMREQLPINIEQANTYITESAIQIKESGDVNSLMNEEWIAARAKRLEELI